MTVLATNDSWRIVDGDGNLVPVRISGGDVQVGQPKREIVQAPFSPSVFLSDGDGEWQAQEIPIDFIVRGQHGLDKFGARAEEADLKAALRYPVGMFGARSKEGLYLPLRGALPDGDPLEGEPGQRILPYKLIAGSVKENTLERGWQYLMLDAADVTQNVTVANQSRPDAPVLTFRPTSRWSAPVPFARMPQGTFFTGHLFSSIGSYNLMSLGLPTEAEYAQSLTFDTGSFFARAGTTGSITVPASAVGGLGYPIFWAMTFQENRLLRLYSFSRFGFQDHVSSPVGEIKPLATRRLYLGSTTNAGITGQMFPGAPRFAAPALTHRVLDVSEIREALGREYAYHAAVPVFTEPELIPGITLTIDQSFSEIVAGQSATFSLTVTKTGGFTGELEVLFDSSDSGVRPVANEQEDEEDDDTGIVSYDGLVTVAEGVPVREYTVGVTVRAVGWTSSGPLRTVRATGQMTFEVEATPAAPDVAAKSRHMFWSPQAYDLNILKRDSVGSGTYPFNLRGLARYSIRGEAGYFDGTDIAPYGKTYGDVDDLISMGADHARAVGLWNAASAPAQTVFAAFASKTVKGDYWYLYKGQSGLQVKLAGGGGTNLTDTPSLPVTDGVMHVAVRFDKTNNKVYLVNTKTKAQTTPTDGRAWSGNGLFTAFAMKQQDGTVSLVSKGTLLYQVGFPNLPSVDQLEREAAYQETFMLRTAAWEREEWPDGTDYILEAINGEIYRNRHPATQSVFANLTTVASPTTTSDSWKTNGTTQIVYTPVLNRNITAANDAVFAMRDFRGGGNATNKVQIGMTAQNSSAIYFRAHMSANANNKRALSAVAPGSFATVQSDAVVPTGDRTFSFRYASGRVTFEDIGSGEVVAGTLEDASVISGNLVYSLGGTKRQDSTTQATFFAVSETKGFILAARALTTVEKQSAARNLQNVWDYSTAPPGGGTGGGGATAPTISSFTASPTAINSGSSATLTWATSGTVTALSISGVGTVTGTSTSVSPTTTTTYILTASNGSASSTASVTVTVNGTGGGTGGSTSPFAPEALASYNKDTLYPTGSQSRAYVDVLDKALALNFNQFSLGGEPPVPSSWNGTKAQFEANLNTAGWHPSGCYNTGRMDGINLDNMAWFFRIVKDPAWLARGAELMTTRLDVNHDYRGSPDSPTGWRERSYPKALSMIYGALNSLKYPGWQLHLEIGAGIGGPFHMAYLLWTNRHLNASYATLAHRERCLYVKHTTPSWNKFWADKSGLYQSDGVTRKFPEIVRRKFFHADTSDWVAAAYWALIETSMYNAGLTAPISVTMKGKDFSTAQYSGTMIDASASETISLDSSTSASVATHVGWQRAVLAFQNWYSSRSCKLMAPSTFRDEAMRTRYPDGAIVWPTGNAGAGATDNFFAAPTTYDNETVTHFLTLYQAGVITAARGSQAEADLFMRRIAAFKAVGAYATTATDGGVKRDGLGLLTNGNTSFNVAVPQITPVSSYAGNNDVNSSYRNMTMGLTCWDSSGYLDSCLAKIKTNKGSNATNGTLPGGAAVALMKLKYTSAGGS